MITYINGRQAWPGWARLPSDGLVGLVIIVTLPGELECRNLACT